MCVGWRCWGGSRCSVLILILILVLLLGVRCELMGCSLRGVWILGGDVGKSDRG